MRTLIMAEGEINPLKLISILCFDGAPITAKFISESIIEHLDEQNISQTAEKIK
jgi:2-oxoglutarate ferredoxin oxidoreductase subunit alpha